MEYDRQIEIVTIWGAAVREWLLLDSGSREDLLIHHAEILAPLNDSAFSTATRYSDWITVMGFLNDGSKKTQEASNDLELVAPKLLEALKNLAAMDFHGSKVD